MSDNSGRLEVSYTPADHDFESQQLTHDIAALFGTPARESIQSALPLSVITITAAFESGDIAHELLTRLGARAHLLKEKLKALQSLKSHPLKGRLLVFDFLINWQDSQIKVQILLRNPNASDIDSFFEEGLQNLNTVLPSYLAQANKRLKELVLVYANKEFSECG